MADVVITIPTYNERENIRILIGKILELKIPGVLILVIDDNSPDGTAEVVREIGKKDKRVKLLLRTGPRGRGAAGKDGFLAALKEGADLIVEMDADMSHDPKYIPKLLEELNHADMALGSRLVSGGEDNRKSFFRRIITKLANFYIHFILGIRVKDCNSGFRAYTRKALEAIEPGKIFSQGPAIVQEVLYRAHLKGLRIKEIPISFKERERGTSKLGIPQLWKGYVVVLKLKLLHWFGRM
ncbi:polyprenol monophosphomannose synthase [Candidatus Woesearchaeota archaeon]|nr:polyprenol monophosphomannose synthase [Candidatus Woesearchaeota archaeon]